MSGTLFMGGSAGATVTAGCSGQVNDRSFQSISLASPMRITENQTLNTQAGSQLKVRLYVVRMYYFGIRYAIRGGSTTNNSWQGSFNASQVFTRGAGNYIVEGILTNNQVGVVCLAKLYFRVNANPLEGPVGQAAGGITATGLIGMIATAVTGGKTPPGFESTTTPEEEEKIKEHQEEEKKDPGEDERKEAEWKAKTEGVCWFLVLPGLLMTAGMMASGGASAMDVVSPSHVRWRPRLSFVGIGSGVLFALGSGVLLQQYGVIWPTLGMGIGFLVGGLILGIMVPTLARLRVVRKLNRRLAPIESGALRALSEPDQALDEDLAAEGTDIPADWYPDPSGEARLRYWDGTEWTSHTAD